MSRGRLENDNNFIGIQGFSPRIIQNISAGSVDVRSWTAFCFPQDDVIYQLNGAGETATLPANSVRVVSEGTTSVTFSGFTTAKCEVM